MIPSVAADRSPSRDLSRQRTRLRLISSSPERYIGAFLGFPWDPEDQGRNSREPARQEHHPSRDVQGGFMSKKIAIVGAGWMAAYHVAGFRGAGAEVVAIADKSPAAAKAAAQKYGVEKTYGETKD